MVQTSTVRCKGTSTLEFIVVLPSLLLLFLASVELSRAWLTLNLVTQAAREGARIGAVNNSCPTAPCSFNPASAIARINTVLSGANLIASTTPTVTCSAPCGPDSQVTATVSVNFQTVVPLLQPLMGGAAGIPVTNTAVMRFE